MDSHKRSLIKGISWRLAGTLSTVLLVFIFTQNLTISFSVGLIEFVAKTLLFYVHERLWNKIHWGQKITDQQK